MADSSEGLLDILRKELATTDYALLHAKDGQEAIECIELLESEIDLAIIELELPVVSGLDVIWQLVRRKQPKPTRIIATTSITAARAVDVPLLKQVVKELGVDAVVQTPMPVQDWRKTIEAVLSGEPSGYSQGTVSSAAGSM